MRTLPSSLDKIPGLRHTIYADNITLWTATGSDGQIEETLQRAADAVVHHATRAGLKCSESKSELLLLRPPHRRKIKQPPLPIIRVYVNSTALPLVNHMRILGLHVQTGQYNTTTLDRLTVVFTQTARLIARAAARRQGMREKKLLQLIHAFAISRIAYALPYLRLLRTKKDRVERLIRKVYKLALGLTPTTSTMHLMNLGLPNTLEELIEAHRTAQIRLRGSKTGRWILNRIGLTASPSVPRQVDP